MWLPHSCRHYTPYSIGLGAYALLYNVKSKIIECSHVVECTHCSIDIVYTDTGRRSGSFWLCIGVGRGGVVGASAPTRHWVGGGWGGGIAPQKSTHYMYTCIIFMIDQAISSFSAQESSAHDHPHSFGFTS